MGEYINLNEVILLASKASECNFRQVPRKKIMFQGQKPNGETITLCSPQSKMHPQGFYWLTSHKSNPVCLAKLIRA